MKYATFETDLSYHDELTTTILKKTIIKLILRQCSIEISRDLTNRNLNLS